MIILWIIPLQHPKMISIPIFVCWIKEHTLYQVFYQAPCMMLCCISWLQCVVSCVLYIMATVCGVMCVVKICTDCLWSHFPSQTWHNTWSSMLTTGINIQECMCCVYMHACVRARCACACMHVWVCAVCMYACASVCMRMCTPYMSVFAQSILLQMPIEEHPVRDKIYAADKKEFLGMRPTWHG